MLLMNAALFNKIIFHVSFYTIQLNTYIVEDKLAATTGHKAKKRTSTKEKKNGDYKIASL